MGKWYYEGDGKLYFSSSPSYKEMERPHTKVHELVLETIKCVTNNTCMDDNKFDNIVSNMAQKETSSRELFTHLENMVREVNPNVNF
jgi:hypothetical protein